jgi:hypothetical protein
MKEAGTGWPCGEAELAGAMSSGSMYGKNDRKDAGSSSNSWLCHILIQSSYLRKKFRHHLHLMWI